MHPAYQSKRRFFDAGGTREYRFRVQQLQSLRAALHRHEARLAEALRQDLDKPAFEAVTGETGVVHQEIAYLLEHLEEWMRPDRRPTPFHLWPARSQVQTCPLGVVLIVAPWNYPVQLSLIPLAGAIAAGNCAVLKPSEDAPATAAALTELIGEALAPDHVSVVEGVGAEVIPALLTGQRFDHVFFTGSTAVGRKIMTMAAGQLTPVTLELGGKSPAVVLEDADLDVTARRLAWGKFYNAGQSCVAPDYALVAEKVREPLIEKLAAAIPRFYGAEPLHSPDLGRIIHRKRFEKLLEYLPEGRLRHGGQTDPERLRIAPTLMDEIVPGAALLRDEIFGPILPVMPFGDEAEIGPQVARNPYPLAAYVFSRSTRRAQAVLDSFSFGGGCINDTLLHFANGELPFGGVGTSGMGRYHGRDSFDVFSHRRSVLQSPRWEVPLRYPPYSAARTRVLSRWFRR